jgi:ABC-type Fe3+/spermidine/putrescine transport system ATPase subunit
MDEPFSALNEDLRYEMRFMLKKIHKKNNVTIVFVIHDKEEACFLSDRIMTIETGTLK